MYLYIFGIFSGLVLKVFLHKLSNKIIIFYDVTNLTRQGHMLTFH